MTRTHRPVQQLSARRSHSSITTSTTTTPSLQCITSSMSPACIKPVCLQRPCKCSCCPRPAIYQLPFDTLILLNALLKYATDIPLCMQPGCVVNHEVPFRVQLRQLKRQFARVLVSTHKQSAIPGCLLQTILLSLQKHACLICS